MTSPHPVGLFVARATSTNALWQRFADLLLAEAGGCQGPGSHTLYAWLTHRLQRDRLWAAAARRGLRGWLQPPHAFFSDFPRAFGIDRRRLGHLERTVLLDRLVTEAAAETGFAAAGLAGSFDRPGIGRAVDAFLADLLPEGVDPDQLESALASLSGADAFAEARNRWLVTLYRRYLAVLAERNAYDPRAIHSLVADRIAAGGLPAAINGARRLHIYGLASARHRRKLLRALADQRDVEVVIYLLDDAVDEEFAGLTDAVATIPDGDLPAPVVQPAPDQEREIEFVALEIKKLVAAGRVPLDEIAVVARTGREDARFAHESLERAGIPTTARVRTPLAEVPALAAVLQLLRASALGWRFRPLRHVLESSYFRLDVDLRPIDHLAGRRRVHGLADWGDQLAYLAARLEQGDDDKELKAFRAERLQKTVQAFAAFADRAATLVEARPLAAWIAATRELLDPGWFDFRKRICRIDGNRHDLVRLDQQGVEAANGLLHQWADTAIDDTPVTALQWYQRLRRLLTATEVTLSTPRRTGVQVVEAHEAALVPFQHTFLIHANEGQFPKAETPGWLFNEDERRALAAYGLPVAHRDATLRRERLLWESVTRGPAVTVTYRTADPGGTPLLPSLLVPDHDITSEIPRTRFVWDAPFTSHLAERAEVERVKVAIERGGPHAPVLTTAPDAVRIAILRAVAESHRLGHAALDRGAGDLGPWTGHLRDPAVLEVLAEKFGPQRVWSASQLEGWGQNPFVFLVQRVLYLEEKLEAEDDANVMVQGSVAHSILEEFFRTAGDGLPLGSDALADALDRVATGVFDTYERDPKNWLGLPALWRIRRKALHDLVRGYLTWELDKGLKGWTPKAFEFAFGGEGEPAAHITGTTIQGESTTIRMRGKIDRIDFIEDKKGARHRVIDYKSGGTPTPAGYLDGGVLQGPLYLAVLSALGWSVDTAEYRSLKMPGSKAKVEWESDKCRQALRLALTIPVLVREGRFEPGAAESTGWKPYWPGGLALYRCEVKLEGSRFE